LAAAAKQQNNIACAQVQKWHTGIQKKTFFHTFQLPIHSTADFCALRSVMHFHSLAWHWHGIVSHSTFSLSGVIHLRKALTQYYAYYAIYSGICQIVNFPHYGAEKYFYK
jgi:hypothetical protein